MFSKDLVISHLERLGLVDFEISAVEKDNDGDYIKCFIPELTFDMVKSKLLTTKYFKVVMDKSEIGKLSFKITEFINGYKTLYRLEVAKESFGVSFSTLVKRIDYYDNFGNYKPCLGYAMMNEYLSRDKEDAEVQQATSIE